VKVICDTLGVARSNIVKRVDMRTTCSNKSCFNREADKDLLEMIRGLVDQRPTYGYRRITALLNQKLRKNQQKLVNHKRVYRLMKMNGLLLQRHTGRPNRSHDGKVITLKSNMRWCSDVFTIQCWNGDKVWVAFSLDTCDREAMRYIASTVGIDGAAIRDLMLETAEYRLGKNLSMPCKIQWLSDNGSIYTAKETVEFGRQLGFDICTTPVHSPESNGMAEAFVKTFKRDYAWAGDLKDAPTVMRQLPDWFEDYNERAPHKGLKMRSPRQFLREINRA
jgi:putative transposase